MSIEQEIANWATTRPDWQRSAIKRLAQGHSFDQADVEIIATRLKNEETFKNIQVKATDVRGGGAENATVLLHAIRDAHNVNALIDGQELTFETNGLTVVFGNNGSGKTGYARIVKDVVGARHQENIHCNVFADTSGQPQKAEIIFNSDGRKITSLWPDSVSSDLKSIRFYDSACGDIYIERDSELTYRPSALALLDRLITHCDDVQAVLNEEITKNNTSRRELPSVQANTDAAKFLDALSGKTTDNKIDEATITPEDAGEQHAGLIQEEARLKATNPVKERKRIEELASKLEKLSAHVEHLEEAFSNERIAEAKKSVKKAKDLRKVASVASSTTFEGEPVTGVGTETWRELWEAATQYSESEAYRDQHFPVTSDDAHCVLCHQELSTDASLRLNRFQSFIRDATEQQAGSAEKKIEETNKTLNSIKPMTSKVTEQVLELKAQDSELAETLTTWFGSVTKCQSAILTHIKDANNTDVPLLKPSPRKALNALASDLRDKEGSIDETKFKQTLEGVTKKKDDLEGHITLAKRRDDIEHEIQRLAELSRLEAAKRDVDTSAITRKMSDLAEKYVTKLVRDRFTLESERLLLDRVELKKTGGHKGKYRHRPSLLGAKTTKPVDEVLSEGEQTALGLAGYFTEAQFDESKSALVLDDPVSSLDHIRRRRVAKRLAQLALDRQVIIFTHNLEFVGDLRKVAEGEQVGFTERGIQCTGDKLPGVCFDYHPWKAKDVKRRFNVLETQLAKIKRNKANWNQEEYEKECCDWGGKLSETWERLVGQEIVHQVFSFDTSEVHPRMFKVLACITEEDNREFQQSYSLCSVWACRHDKSPATNYVAPETDELEQELTLVRDWCDRVKKYRN